MNAVNRIFSITLADCVRLVLQSTNRRIKTKTRDLRVFVGGQGWIRTIEVTDGRFTVCSLWPLGNLPMIGAGDRNRTNNLLITNQLLCLLSYTSTY